MSDLAGSDLTYQAVVAEYFLGLRGGGLMLSPLDQELVAEWERRGLPVAVVCRGLSRGLEELVRRRAPGAGSAAPRSLRALRFSVEEAWSEQQARSIGDAPPPPPSETGFAAARLAAARARLLEASQGAPPAWAQGYRAALAELGSLAPVASLPELAAQAALNDHQPGPTLAQVEAAIAAADARLLSAWLASLDRPRRTALGPRLALRAGPRGRGSSRSAHRETLRLHLLDAARGAGLTCLRGSV
jgi:hypothetical protein